MLEKNHCGGIPYGLCKNCIFNQYVFIIFETFYFGREDFRSQRNMNCRIRSTRIRLKYTGWNSMKIVKAYTKNPKLRTIIIFIFCHFLPIYSQQIRVEKPLLFKKLYKASDFSWKWRKKNQGNQPCKKLFFKIINSINTRVYQSKPSKGTGRTKENKKTAKALSEFHGNFKQHGHQ